MAENRQARQKLFSVYHRSNHDYPARDLFLWPVQRVTQMSKALCTQRATGPALLVGDRQETPRSSKARLQCKVLIALSSRVLTGARKEDDL